VQSEYWLSFVRSLGRTDNVYVVSNFVDGASIMPNRPASASVPVFLFCAGSEARRKGIDELLEAIALMRPERVPAKFRIIAATARIEDAVTRLGLRDIVETEGYRTRAQMMTEYRFSDVFLLPTRAEGFPNALLEAMAAALAVVVTAVGAIPEVVVDGEGGLYTEVDNPRQLKSQIVRLASDPALRSKFGASNQRRVLENFTARTVLPQLEAAYYALLGDNTIPEK
jgi:glycosyltransferase involved in cell wall biosynthesis